MADQDLNLKVNLQGAGAASSGLAGLVGQLSSFGPAAIIANQGLELLQKGLEALKAPFQQMTHLADEAIAMWKQMRDLSNTTGGTMQQAEDLKDVFELAGVGSEKLNMAMFRLGAELENGGKKLAHLGIETRHATGEAMNAGEAFLAVRDKIAGMATASERASAASELWGSRMGRGMIPILSISRDKFAELTHKAEENGALTAEVAAKAEKLVQTQADLAQKLEKVKMQFAELIALPVSQWFADTSVSMLKMAQDAASRVSIALEIGAQAGNESALASTGAVGGFFARWLGAAFIDRDTAAAIAASRKLEAELSSKLKAMQDIKDRGPKDTFDAKLEGDRQKAIYTQEQSRIKSEATIAQELSKMRTGSDQEAIQNKIRTNTALIALAEENYQKERDIATKKLKGGGRLTDAEEFALSSKRDTEIAKLKADNDKMLQVDMAKSRIVDAKKLADEEMLVLKQTETERLSIIESGRKREQAIYETQNMVTLTKTTLAYYADVAALKQATFQKIDSINQQIDAQKKLAAAAPLDFEVQKVTNDKIRELQLQRAQTERDTNDKILDSRKSLVDKLKQEADKQAGIGASLEEKALRNLEKQGNTEASMQDVQREVDRLKSEARETAANFGWGGRVSIDALRESRQLAPTINSLTESGITSGQALGMNQQKSMTQLSGRMWDQVPAQLQDTMKSVDQVMSGMGSTLERMTAAIGALYDGFSTRMIRELEFQAARR